MSAFGNLFSMESQTTTNYTSYADAFKNTDSFNITATSADSLKDVLTTTLNLNQPTDWKTLTPVIAIGAVVLLVVAIILRR